MYGMRTIGKGYAGARKLCAIMNMPSPPTEKAFIFNSRVIGRHVKIIAEESMKKAGQDVYALKSQETSSATGPVNCGISCDGTWQKRGYSSRNGCVTVISMDTGRVIDVEALSQGCKQCERHEHLDKASLECQTGEQSIPSAKQTSGDQHQPWSWREQIAYFGGLLKNTTSDTLNFMVMVTVRASQG